MANPNFRQRIVSPAHSGNSSGNRFNPTLDSVNLIVDPNVSLPWSDGQVVPLVIQGTTDKRFEFKPTYQFVNLRYYGEVTASGTGALIAGANTYSPTGAFVSFDSEDLFSGQNEFGINLPTITGLSLPISLYPSFKPSGCDITAAASGPLCRIVFNKL